MKNFKRLVAAALAATMALALSVSAFAEVEVKDAVKASYADGKAAYTETITAKDGTPVLNETFTFNSDAPTVELALTEACAKASVELVLSEYGTIEKIGEVVLEEGDFWDVKIDGKEVALNGEITSGTSIAVSVGTIVAE